MEQQVEATIVDLIVEITNGDRDLVLMETPLKKLGLDSIDRVDLALAIEEETGVGIPDDKMEQFKTVDDIVDYVDKNLDRA